MNDIEAGLVDWNWRSKRNKLQLNAFDIMDRVINLKFITASKGSDGTLTPVDTYVLRSDYELCDSSFVRKVAENNLSYTNKAKIQCIRKCKIKPSIKVQYKQVSGNTAIELDIFVHNFFMLSRDGNTLLSFNGIEYPLAQVEVQMGYFGQFADKYRLEEGGVPSLNDFFDMPPIEGVQALKCNVEYSQTDSLPPDATLHIHGYCSSCYNSPVKEIEEIELSSIDKSMVYTYQDATKDNYQFKNFLHYIYNNITRRYLRDMLPADTKDEAKTLKLKFDDKKALDDESSLKYGVRIFFSEGFVTENNGDNFFGKQTIKDAEGNVLPDKKSSVFTKPLSGKSPMQALNSALNSLNGNFRVAPLPNGDYFVFLADELKLSSVLSEKTWYTFDPTKSKDGVDLDGDKKVTAKEIGVVALSWQEIQGYVKSCLVEHSHDDVIANRTVYAKKYRASEVELTVLPAVNNISYDNGLCTIVCPFFFFTTPFQKVKFVSRYALGGLVSYFTAMSKATEFTVLWQSVSFATSENINDVHIVCVGEGD